jgi:hypothetical protein
MPQENARSKFLRATATPFKPQSPIAAVPDMPLHKAPLNVSPFVVQPVDPATDGEFAEVAASLRGGKDVTPIFQRLKLNPAHCELHADGGISVQGRKWVKSVERHDVLKLCHDIPTAGHRGEAGTMELLRRDYY